MKVPVRFGSLPSARPPALAAGLLCLLLGACASSPRSYGPLDLDRQAPKFSQGRVTVVLLDEYGIAMSGLKVDLTWQEPNFYKTSAFTNRQGEVTFSGVPDIAEVSVDYPGGNYTRTMLVPQSGLPELRLMLDTYGGAERLRQQERERLAPRVVPQGGR